MKKKREEWQHALIIWSRPERRIWIRYAGSTWEAPGGFWTFVRAVCSRLRRGYALQIRIQWRKCR